MRVMRERERIALFSKYCQEYGVSDTATFPTESLSEKVDLSQVTICIRALGIEVSFNYAFPTGSVYGFGMKWRGRTPTISESASNLKNSAYIPPNRPILHIVWTD